MNDMSKVEPPPLRFEAPPSTSLLAHARHIVSENPVTGLAFGLFALILFAAIFGAAGRALRSTRLEHQFGAQAAEARPTGSAPTSSAAISSAG
jgi:hypothetical protein